MSKVEDLFAPLVLDIRFANIPLARNDPIEDCGPRRHLVNLKLDVRTYCPQRLPDATTGDTAANRVYLGDKSEDFLADILRDELLVKKSAIIHDVAWS